MSRRLKATAALAAVLAGVSATGGQAEEVTVSSVEPATLVALVNNRTLVTVDVETATVTNRVTVKGITGRLIGIDVRPADGKLYGVAGNGAVVTIDPATGETLPVSVFPRTFPDDVRYAVDFNPVPNRLRIIGSNGDNLRTDVDTGTVSADTNLTFVEPNPFGAAPGTVPQVIGAAYSNSIAGARVTLLWDIDDVTDALYVQVPPNGGVLNPVAGPIGLTFASTIGFDIQTMPGGANRAVLINGAMLYRVGLVSGDAFDARRITSALGTVRDLAVLPIVDPVE